jgi:3'(2'), 5'-bisphosphate nucleotidase
MEAGGKISDTLGQPLDFSTGRTLRNNKGIVATSSGVFNSVLQATIESA